MDSAIQNYAGTETLLIVDDDKSVLNLLSDLFTATGYTVIKAKNGEEAVEIYKNRRGAIHLVLMDVVMPRKDGIAASAEIMELDPQAIICLMSAFTSEVNAELSTIRFISKPFLPSKVVKIVRASLDGNSCAYHEY